MFVLSSPSGAGKTTISRKLLEADQQLRMSVSATTRPIRPGEIDGRDYHFCNQETFDRMLAGGDFLEYATVFGNKYGTPRAQIEEGLDAGQDYLFDIDWQGTQQLRHNMGEHVVPVFLLPPSLEELRERLTSRGTDSSEVIGNRMERARDEISHWDGYDYVVINDDVERCFARVQQILASERMRRERQTGLVTFVRQLMATED